MSGIYQQIWDADQAGSGLQAITANQNGDPARGFVQVDTAAIAGGGAGRETKILKRVELPASKKGTYDLARALFDNYALDEQAVEVETPEEREEVHNLLSAVVDTAPMQVAREYVAAATSTSISRERWYATLLEMWFRRFSGGGDPDLSGFEHVFVGEQQGAKVQGYHFWYKYYLDDGLADAIAGAGGVRFPGLPSDQIDYLGSEAARGQGDFPESVTISFRWKAPDYDAKAVRPLTKPKGGFFVGCSVEGLMAIGTVRAHMAAMAPKEAVINGARYNLAVYRSPDDKNVRTFFPVFLGRAPSAPAPAPSPGTPLPPAPATSGKVRILSALVNPVGHDPGRERVTLQNMGAETLDLTGWRLVDKERKHYQLTDVRLAGGTAATIVLPENTMQLANRGGEIRLVDRAGHTVHLVMYSRTQAAAEGQTIVF